jgi:hypothetical protein
MKRYGIACILALSVTACSACSSGSGSDGGTGGSCKNVDICTVIPPAQLSTSLGVMATITTPSTDNIGGNASDECIYGNPSPAAYTSVTLIRTCHADGVMVAATYDATSKGYLAPMGTRTDLAGVGDKAFYQSEPNMAPAGTNKVKLVAVKGQILVTFTDLNVTPAQDAMVKQGLASFANTLLK